MKGSGGINCNFKIWYRNNDTVTNKNSFNGVNKWKSILSNINIIIFPQVVYLKYI
jgi:hypothetical protein